MNVLLTSVGRRSYLVNYFKEALNGSGKVIGANMFSNAAGMVAADISVITPPANHPDYIPKIIEICKKYDIGLLCSLHDLDVYVLSQNQRQLDDAGIKHTLPSAEWGRICLDKYECTSLFESYSIPVPKTVLNLESALNMLCNDELEYPLIVKVRAGFGSMSLTKCSNKSELISAYHKALEYALTSEIMNYITLPKEEMVLIQQAIEGREVCLSIVNDLSGEYRSHFSCLVHSMRSGESDWATTIDNTSFESVAKKISSLTKHKSIWGVDFLDDNGILRAIDVNPRFTGDYPFHHLAGANIPKVLIAWAKNLEIIQSELISIPGITGFKDLVPKVLE